MEQPWFSTGGTRAKKYLLGPDGKFYFFKRSQYKPATETKLGKDFKYEFWNEIIAYEVGALLGFRMLRYDIAIDGDVIGCISESMINQENQDLNEGIKYLKAFSPDFDPEKKECKARYTFTLIEKALAKAKIAEFIDDIFELIVFDALIGNGDRHQENWAIISQQRRISQAFEDLIKNQKIIPKVSEKTAFLLKRREERYMEKGMPIPEVYYTTDNKFAPIYDSGSSLGRELTEEAIVILLQSDGELEKYISRGLSEIHWGNKKVTHFQLIRNLLASTHQESIRKIIDRVIQNYDGVKIEAIVRKVDQNIPESHSGYSIPELRKQLIFKIITLRFETLKALING